MKLIEERETDMSKTVYLIEWKEQNEFGKAVVQAFDIMEAIEELYKRKPADDIKITLVGEIENDVHVVKDTGIPF